MTIRPCAFYIMNPATGDTAVLDKHGYVERWDTTAQWAHATRFPTKMAAAMALFENSRLNAAFMAYRVVTEI
jgi:hypothetical protein